MTIIGGVYDEICFEPRWEEKYGSGLRACRVINSLDSQINIAFHTFGDDNSILYLDQINKVFPKIKSTIVKIERTISFYYDHPLIIPRIYPRLDTINKENNILKVKGDNVLYFGLIEGIVKVTAKKMVYDPQSPTNPIPFSTTGSKADTLTVVTNFTEASKMANSSSLNDIKNYFFGVENTDILILKIGAKGALVIEKNKQNDITEIPVYQTSTVWPIGSGDVFASTFAYYWFSGLTANESAAKASRLTAHYCSTKNFDFFNLKNDLKELVIKEIPKGQVYLAGPFFTYAERWLIDQVRTCLKDIRLDVFSPWHDIGHGDASEVVGKDIKGLEESKLVFAIIDGLDSGTLFEVGYAVSKNIPVIAYVENESVESIKMLEGTGCILENDLTTAIYKSLWILAENE
ncbi:MAG: PfkB family carbohydrate kinase [Ginsengibacter sp.]